MVIKCPHCKKPFDKGISALLAIEVDVSLDTAFLDAHCNCPYCEGLILVCMSSPVEQWTVDETTAITIMEE